MERREHFKKKKNGEKHLKSLDIMGGNQGGMNYKCEITFVWKKHYKEESVENLFNNTFT